jgi:Ca-activated chloride channel family protein
MIELELVPHRAALLVGHDNTLDVLLRAKAPPAPETRRGRSPLNLAIVVDRSSSMAGRPLAEAKRCAAMIIDGLSAKDRASVVVYDHVVDVLVASRPVDDKGPFHTALGTVVSRGSTALHAGWLTGAEEAAGAQLDQTLSRVLLLSDGCANQGLCETSAIAKHCAEMADVGVGTSTYGLGEHFNEELMTAMARAGLGNAYYGLTAEDLMDPFREEFDLMTALSARHLRLSLAPAEGVRIEVVNQYRTDAEGRTMLPDLADGGEAWAVLRVTVPRSLVDTGGAGDVHLLTASLAYTGLDGRPGQSQPVHLRLPRVPAAAFAAIAVNELVARRAAELRAAALQEEGRQAAQMGDWGRVQGLLRELRALAEGNAWLSASVEQLEAYARHRETQRFSKEAYYKAAKMRSRLATPDEGSEWYRGDELAKPSYLRRKLEQGKRLDDPDRDKSGSAK